MTEKKGFRDPKKKETEKLVHKLVEAIDEHPDKVNNYYDLGSLRYWTCDLGVHMLEP